MCMMVVDRNFVLMVMVNDFDIFHLIISPGDGHCTCSWDYKTYFICTNA